MIRYEVRSLAGAPRQLQPFQFALSGAALIILLIACANVANLLIVRVVTREREIAVRMALGASRRDVGRFVFGEAIVLAVAGGALGLLLAAWSIHLIEYRFTMDVSQIGLLQPHFDWRVAAASALASALVVVLIAWGATVRARATNVNEAMQDGAATTTQPAHRSHGLLAVTEVALSLVVLMGAGLLLRASQAIRHFDFGYDPRHIVSTTVARPRRDSTTSLGEEFYADVRNGIRALPGVRGVATTYEETVPASAVTSDVGGASPRVARIPTYSVVSPEFFHLVGIAIKQGRDFEPGDVDSAGAAIVDETLARMLWPHESPLQHLVKLGGPRSNGPWVRVVGVVPPIRFSFTPGRDPDQAMAVHPNVWVASRRGAAHGALRRTDAVHPYPSGTRSRAPSPACRGRLPSPSSRGTDPCTGPSSSNSTRRCSSANFSRRCSGRSPALPSFSRRSGCTVC